MTSDDQQFLDLLASVPHDIATYGGKLADYVEKHANALATDIRDALDRSSWFPDSLRNPSRAVASNARFSRVPAPPQSVFEKTTAWVVRNQTAIAVVVAFAGTTAYLVHRKKKAHVRKRRAKKQPNGAKKEIVVLACSTFQDPLTRSLALDLERRGYVVYVTVSSAEEDALVQQEGKIDLRPLWIDLTSTVPNPAVDIHPNLEPIREQLLKSSPSSSPGPAGRSRQGTTLCNMQLSGIVVFPGCSGYPDGTLALLPPSDVIDTINTRLISPLLTIQQFLPLLATYSVDPQSPASIIIAYPSIPRALSPPYQIPESIITSSLSSLAASLKREVVTMSANITVHELKLGNFDLGSVPSGQTPTQSTYFHGQQQQQHQHQQRQGGSDPSRSALTHWHSSQRAAIQRSSFGQRSLIRGSSARELHNAVFDALAPPQQFKAFGVYEWQIPRRSSTVFVGSGARLYDIVGAIVPSGIVGLIMGYRSQSQSARFGGGGGGGEQAEASGVWGLATAAANNTTTTTIRLDGGYHQNLDASLGSDSAAWEKV